MYFITASRENRIEQTVLSVTLRVIIERYTKMKRYITRAKQGTNQLQFSWPQRHKSNRWISTCSYSWHVYENMFVKTERNTRDVPLSA